MDGPSLRAGHDETRSDLHEATGVARGDPFRARLSDPLQLRRENPSGELWLQQIVDPGAAAALIGVGQRHEIDPGYGPEHCQWCIRYALRM